MSRIWIQTEALYRKRLRVFRDETDREFISAKDLVGVLNSAAEPGPDRYYVVEEEIIGT